MPTYNWTSAINGRWEAMTRWTPTGVPDSGFDDALITVSGASYTVALENYKVSVTGGGSTEVRTTEVNNLSLGSSATLDVAMDTFFIEGSAQIDGRMNIGPTSTVFVGALTGSSTSTWDGSGKVVMANGGRIAGVSVADPTLLLKTELLVTIDNGFASEARMDHMSLEVEGVLRVDNGADLIFDGDNFTNKAFVVAKDAGTFLSISALGALDNRGSIIAEGDAWISINTTDIYNTGLIIAQGPVPSNSAVNALDISGIIDQRSNQGHGVNAGVIESNGFGSVVTIKEGAVYGGTLRTTNNGEMFLSQVTLNGIDQPVTIENAIKAGGVSVVGTIKGLSINSVLAIDDSTMSSAGAVLANMQVTLESGTISGSLITLDDMLVSGTGEISAPLIIDAASRVEAFSFFGQDTLTLNSGTTLQNGGELQAIFDNRLIIADKVTGVGKVTLSDGGDVTFLKEFNQNINVLSSSAKEEITFSHAYSGAIKGLGVGDTINLAYAAAHPDRTATYTGNAFNGTLKISNPNGSLFTSILLTGDYRNTGFALSADGAGGTLIALTDKSRPTEGPDNLLGTADPDTIDALGGDDTITGLGGNDTLIGGTGSDTLIGGTGNDTYVIDSSGDIVDESVAGSDGVDTVRSSNLSINLNFASKFKGLVENAALDGSAALSLTGNGLDNKLTGNSGVNSLDGGGGHDTLDGKGGSDTLKGFTGNDTYHVDSSGDIVDESIAGSNGSDTVRSSNVSINLGFSSVFKGTIESAVLEGSTSLNLTGNTLVNYLQGNSGANVINGGGGSDTLVGLGGNDIFRFANSLGAANIDKITDYNPAQDRIELDNAYFTALVEGFLYTSAFVANTTGLAQDASDRIIYETDTGKLFFDSNGTASGGTYQQFATLSAGLTMTAGEFFVT